ncbi:MAG: YaeQ family protein [Xanthomonadaceae bacterium]|nr:YaeQ family protein [Xanthomonadaceae bacterium]
MALKPTIYKLKIALTDLNRNHYDALTLTVAQHPSETLERMMARVLAYCIDASERLEFTKGLSEADAPDILERTRDGQLALWIDIGEPAVERIKKASRIAEAVKVYSFNAKSGVWWQQSGDKFAELDVSVFKFGWDSIKALAAMVERTMDISVTISGDSAYIATAAGECEIGWETLLHRTQAR